MSCLSELESVAEEWDSLAMASGDPFLTVAWLSAWWRTYDGAIAVLAVRESNGHLVAGLPCRRISPTTWGSPTNAESGSWGVLAADESTRRQVWRALADVAPRRLRLQCLLDRENVEAARDELEAAGYRTVTTSGPRSPYLELPATYEELLASVSHNLRSQVSRRRRSLEKLGVVRLRDVRGGDELEGALRTVLWLEGSGWKSRAGTSILSDPATEKLYCSFARAAAEAGWLRLYILEVDGQPIAADFGCSFNGVGYLLKTGFDVEFQRYSPGLVLRAEVLKASIEEGLSGYDFLGGPDPYKLRWASTIRPRFGLRAYRGAPLSAEWLYWRHARPLLRWVAWQTVRRSRPPCNQLPSLSRATPDPAGTTPAGGEVGAASPLVVLRRSIRTMPSWQGLSVEEVTLPTVDAGLIEAWRELAAEAVEPNPFFSPEVMLPASRWLSEGADVRLIIVRRGARMVLAMPVWTGRYRRIPSAAALTWRHPYCYVGTPLVRADALDEAPAMVLEALARRPRTRALVLQQVYVDGPVAAAFRAAARERSAPWVEHGVWNRPAVEAREEETYLESTLTARSAKALRRHRRHLERDLGPVMARDVARTGDRDAVAQEIEAFLTMEAAGWKGRAGTAVASHPSHAAFWTEACQALAESGRLEQWQLVAGDVVAARQCHVRDGDVVFHLKTTYDESLAQRSPGVQLELDVLHAFHVDPELRRIDPCTDPVPGTSARLYPDVRRLGDALIGLTPAGSLAVRLVPHMVRAWRALGHLQLRGAQGNRFRPMPGAPSR